MSGEGTSPHVACRAVLLAAGLLLFGAHRLAGEGPASVEELVEAEERPLRPAS
jgi:hypothetical protein